MKKNVVKFYLTLLLVPSLTILQAQASITTAGGNASGSGASVSYSIGQIFYQTNFGSTASSAQGVQQPFEISIISSLELPEQLSLKVLIYPNPTADQLTISIENYQNELLSYELYDLNGRLLRRNKLYESQTSFSVEELAPASYILKVKQEGKDLKIFKVIKYTP